ncbi:MAG: SIS domain-containing protein [Sphingomonas sp.]|uniref:SIS domain-containing protein n=1 Tax=Sphingomonas sp. TaxID=28214 RepID=UPI001AD47223|nr:SIS domain-containing protein [Sphingomonas sp.]MBN8806808.1 SIS domain-containing protein [Sphingomonas sp.]
MSDAATIEPTASLMRRETLEAPDAVRRMLARNGDALAELAAQLRARPVNVVSTCARGSSDHAATYGKYLIETLIGVPVASAAPSVASVFASRVTTGDALCIAISQSGRSPDLLATVDAYAKADVPVVALVNDETSPLAERADWLLPLSAGAERSVAATKSCIAAMAGLAALAAAWSGDDALAEAVAALPDLLARAAQLDWSPGLAPLSTARQMFVLGRGYGFGIAQEAALKLKETCAVQAEPFSAAEVRHGPMTIVGPGFPILAFATSDVSGDDVMTVAREFAARGAVVLTARPGGESTLPAIAAHPAIEPILQLASFYGLAEQLARTRGLDPDQPPHLAKVTQTR